MPLSLSLLWRDVEVVSGLFVLLALLFIPVVVTAFVMLIPTRFRRNAEARAGYELYASDRFVHGRFYEAFDEVSRTDLWVFDWVSGAAVRLPGQEPADQARVLAEECSPTPMLPGSSAGAWLWRYERSVWLFLSAAVASTVIGFARWKTWLSPNGVSVWLLAALSLMVVVAFAGVAVSWIRSGVVEFQERSHGYTTITRWRGSGVRQDWMIDRFWILDYKTGAVLARPGEPRWNIDFAQRRREARAAAKAEP